MGSLRRILDARLFSPSFVYSERPLRFGPIRSVVSAQLQALIPHWLSNFSSDGLRNPDAESSQNFVGAQ